MEKNKWKIPQIAVIVFKKKNNREVKFQRAIELQNLEIFFFSDMFYSFSKNILRVVSNRFRDKMRKKTLDSTLTGNKTSLNFTFCYFFRCTLKILLSADWNNITKVSKNGKKWINRFHVSQNNAFCTSGEELRTHSKDFSVLRRY